MLDGDDPALMVVTCQLHAPSCHWEPMCLARRLRPGRHSAPAPLSVPAHSRTPAASHSAPAQVMSAMLVITELASAVRSESVRWTTADLARNIAMRKLHAHSCSTMCGTDLMVLAERRDIDWRLTPGVGQHHGGRGSLGQAERCHWMAVSRSQVQRSIPMSVNRSRWRRRSEQRLHSLLTAIASGKMQRCPAYR